MSSIQFKFENMKVLTVAEVVIFIICGTLFSLQVKEQLARFFRGERAFTFQTSIKEDLRFPALAFCPKEGFKSKVMEVQLGLGNRFFWTDLRYGIVWEGHHVFGDTKIPQSKAEFDRWWTESTLGVDDILRWNPLDLLDMLSCTDSLSSILQRA